MKKRQIPYCKIAFTLILITSISINILFYISDIHFYLKAKKIIRTQETEVPISNNIQTFQNNLLKWNNQFFTNGERNEFPATHLFFTDRIKKNDLFKSETSECPTFLYSEPAYILVATLDDAIKRNDKNEIKYIKDIFDKKIYNFPLQITDQSTCGIISIMLYKYYKDSIYKRYAKTMYQWLLKQDSKYGILYRNNIISQIVDVLGMVPPFLYLYANTFHCDSAQYLADKTIDKFITYGTDYETGFPAFSFRIKKPHIKIGMANWGRGVSWFAIGLLYNNPQNLSKNSQKVIQKFNENLKQLYIQDGHFSQFIGEKGMDLSAEIPLLYYMHKKNILKVETNDILQYSKYMHDGLLYNSSSSNNGIIRYGINYGPNTLSQAFIITLINEIL